MPFLAVIFFVFFASAASAQLPPEQRGLAREIFELSVNSNTTESSGSTRKLAEALAGRLRAAGFAEEDVKVLATDERKGNLWARLRGTGKSKAKPILTIAHLDVVEARKEDWSDNLDPFKFTEQDGHFYGRGTRDNKAGVATLVANFIRLKQEGYNGKRDLLMLLTADEETDAEKGIKWVLEKHRDLIDAEYTLNADAGEVALVNGKPAVFGVQAAEKVFLSFRLEATDAGGHSSLPRAENPIYRLAEALVRLSKHQFPVRLNELTRTYLERSAELQEGQQAADMRAIARGKADKATWERVSRTPHLNATLRTTCVATMVEAGHAENALPQRARAVVNCRILPEEDFNAVESEIRRVVADEKITVSPVRPPKPSPASPLRPEFVKLLDELVAKKFPGAVVIPEMSRGATDGLFLRAEGIPVYGTAALYNESGESRAHGRDERVAVESFYKAVDFWYELLRRVGGQQ